MYWKKIVEIDMKENTWQKSQQTWLFLQDSQFEGQ